MRIQNLRNYMELTQEQAILQNNLRKFSQKEVEPLAEKIDKENYFPVELVSKLAEMGLFGILIPEDHGGFGFDVTGYVIVLEELSKVSGSLAFTLATHNALLVNSLLKFGSETMKKKYLPALCTGERIGGVCGQDACELKVAGNTLNGLARFVLNGEKAKILLLAARKDDQPIYILMEKPEDSVEAKTRDDLMGMRGSGIASIGFKGVTLEDAQIFTANKELTEIEAVFQLGLAAIATGISQAALEASIKYSKERHQFGQPISSFDMVQDMLAEIATRVHGARLMVYDAADKKDKGKPFLKEAAMAKIYATKSAAKSTKLGVQIYGGYGYTKDYSIERMFRDAKATEVIGGATEFHKLKLAKSLL